MTRATGRNIALSVAIASLRNLEHVESHGNWEWSELISMWTLKCRLSIASSNRDLVPTQSNWYVCVDKNYPLGEIALIPAKDRGITKTFQHQYYNGTGKTGTLWRDGNICVESGMSLLKKEGYDYEPSTPEKRLNWHLTQAIEWLKQASAGTLVREGEIFELPDYSTRTSDSKIAYCESVDTFRIWETRFGNYGILELGLLWKPESTYIALSFRDTENRVFFEPPWGTYVRRRIRQICIGTWVLFPSTVVLPPWQAPMTWGELAEVSRNQSLHHDRVVTGITAPLIWGRRQVTMLGFPVPHKVGQKPKQIHWQALSLPPISPDASTNLRESKANSATFMTTDFGSQIDSPDRLTWQQSCNWHQNEILNRGKFGSEIVNAKIILIGAGAFGSIISEMLLRGGVTNLTIIDGDKIEIGNLSRHTLLLDDVDTDKATALQKRLSKISPYAEVKALPRKFESLQRESNALIRNASIIIDCSGSDDVIHYLERFQWKGRPVFYSVSTNLLAKRTYVLVGQESRFPRRFFRRHMHKWLIKDFAEYDGPELPRSGGIGCWHPAFPARIDELWLSASCALKYFDSYMSEDKRFTKLAVFEQIQEKDVFSGINLISEETCNE